MSRYATRKNTAAGKAVTLERRSKRRAKRSSAPLNTSALMAEFSSAGDAGSAALARLERRYGL